MSDDPPGVDIWVDALQRVSLTDASRAWLRAHLAAQDCCATEAELEAATGGPIAEYRALAQSFADALSRIGRPLTSCDDPLDLIATDGLLLLRVRRGAAEPLYVVVKHDRMWDDEETWEYFVDEGTCPKNLLRCEALIDGEDADPHGILEYVQWVPRPPAVDQAGERGRAFWRRVFSRLPEAGVHE
jgi:hypothetical protein